MTNYRFNNEIDPETGKEKHLHEGFNGKEWRPRIGISTLVKRVVNKSMYLTWWASGLACADLGWTKPADWKTLKTEDDKKGDYLLKIDKQGGSANFPLYLWDKESFEYHNTKEMLLWYVFMGSLVFFTLLSILTAFLLKNKLFRYYSFFIFIILCYNFI